MKSTDIIKELKIKQTKEKHPSLPDHAVPVPKYSDKTANGLTKCICDFLTLSGWQAERINTMGRMIDNRKTYVDVIGRQRTIGSAKYIPTTGTTGSSDISATIKGRSVKIEVKIGKDRQSDDQIKYQETIESAGGVYVIARNFEKFHEWYENFVKNI